MKSASLIPGVVAICALALAGCDNPPTEPVAAITPTPQLSTSSPHPFVGQIVNLVLLSPNLPEQCMDVVGGVATIQRPVQSYNCWNGPNQQFKIDAAPMTIVVCDGFQCEVDVLRNRADLVIFRSVQNPNLCLDVRAGTANGGEQVQLYTCHYGSNQAFRLPTPSPGAPTYGGLDTEVSGFHMRLEAASANDSYVRQQPSSNWKPQKWQFQPAGTHFRL
jgi:hypothetical protein